MQIIPDELTQLVKKFEGCRLHAYQDSAGIWTCGWGATGPDITPTTVWTQEQADARLLQDLQTHFFGTVLLLPMINGNPLSATGDFAYNLGLTRLKGSTLRRKMLKGDMLGASNEFRKWVRAGGRILAGLIARREAERILFLRK